MKRTRGAGVCMLIGLVLLVLGIAVLAVSFVREGTPGGLLQFLSSAHIAADGFFDSRGDETTDLLLEGDEAPDTLRLQVSAADVQIRVGEAFRVEANGFRDGAVTMQVTDGVLLVRDDEFRDVELFSLDDRRDRSVVVTLPSGVLNEISASLGAGVLTLNDMHAGVLTLEMGAGELRLEAAQGERLHLTMGAGNIDVADAVFEAVTCEAGTVDLAFEGGITRSGSFELGIGAVRMALRGEDYRVQCTTGLGESTVNGQDAAGVAGSVADGVAGAGAQITVETGIGDVEVTTGE